MVAVAPSPYFSRSLGLAAQAERRALSKRWRAKVDRRFLALGWLAAKGLAKYHPVTLEGTEHLPKGPALLVGNHGHLGYETMLFFAAILEKTGALPFGLADRWFFKVPGLRDLLVRIGGTYGDPSNAHELLAKGHWVVSYPGGAREVLKRGPRDLYRLRWAQSRGFARVAIEAGVPIVPFAAAGVDDTYDIAGTYEGTGNWLMGHSKYDLPRLRGRFGPVPRPVPFLFRFGAPIDPNDALASQRVEDRVRELHGNVWRRAQNLLDGTVENWRQRHGGKK